MKKNLNNVFNPSAYTLYFPKDIPNEEEWLKTLEKDTKEAEQGIYDEAVSGLESDLTSNGMELTYSSGIIIREVALTLLIIHRLKKYLILRDIVRNKILTKKSYESLHYSEYPKRFKSRSTDYEQIYTNVEEPHPVLEEIAKLEKKVNECLKCLGLLPVQQMERQKLTIMRKLRQKYENMHEEVSITATKEKDTFSKKKETQENEGEVEEESIAAH